MRIAVEIIRSEGFPSQVQMCEHGVLGAPIAHGEILSGVSIRRKAKTLFRSERAYTPLSILGGLLGIYLFNISIFPGSVPCRGLKSPRRALIG
jgi:hypothetical protein